MTNKQETTMNDDRIFYGPHPCASCGKMIAKAANSQGGEAFDYPDTPIYPNTQWMRHDCQPEDGSYAWLGIERTSAFSNGQTPPTSWPPARVLPPEDQEPE